MAARIGHTRGQFDFSDFFSKNAFDEICRISLDTARLASRLGGAFYLSLHLNFEKQKKNNNKKPFEKVAHGRTRFAAHGRPKVL